MKKQFTIISSLILFTIFSTGLIAQQYKTLSDFPEHIKNTNPFKRFAWDFTQRAFPYDTLPSSKAAWIFRNEIKKMRYPEFKHSNILNWEFKGPKGVLFATYPWWGNISGRVRAIAVHPADTNTVYIGAASGGLWKTSDGGSTWQDIGKDLGSMAYGAIAINPEDPDILFAGSGETLYYLSPSYFFCGSGLYKSFDGGNTWEVDTLSFGSYTNFADIVFSPHDPDILLAALASGSHNLGNYLENEGIWQSTDGGMTWTKTLDLPYACDVMFHPDENGLAYATIGGLKDGSGFYVSDDNGNTWNASNDGLAETTSISRMMFDISASNSDIFYAVAYQPDTGNVWWGTYTNAYKSVNRGESWEQISEGVQLGGYAGSSGWYDQGDYDLCIAVDPLDSDHVYIGNVELHETTDGENFSPVRPYGNYWSGSLVHCDYHQLVYAPSSPNSLFIGCDGGIYRYDNIEDSAYSLNMGLETFQFYRMGSHPTDPDVMIGGLQDNGTVMTFDGGETWEQVLSGDGMECFFDRNNPDIVYASYYNGYLMKSANSGNNFFWWKTVDGAWVTPFFQHTVYDSVYFTANNDIWRFPHDTYPAYVWQKITTDLMPVVIVAFAQSEINPDHMIIAGNNEPLYGVYTNLDTIPVLVSTDGGYNWTNVTENIPGDEKWISRVLTDPNQENTMYIVRCGYSEGNKIYKTTDLGETWTNISGNLPDIPCNTMFIDPENTDHYYIGTDIGAYFSENMGESWEYAGDGMPLIPIMDFEYVKINGTRYLRAATYGRGIFETTDLVTAVRRNMVLSQGSILARPNPYTTETTLEYELHQSSYVQMSLYNHLGKKVTDLVSKNQSEGKHEIKLNGNNLPAGVYFCTLKTHTGIAVKKLIKVE